MDFSYYGTLALLIFGFGFVIFWHELGHFLAAKWAGVKVEQFAVGFGQALISWRKGLGFRSGSSAKEFDRTVSDYLSKQHPSQQQSDQIEYHTPDRMDAAARELGLGETEYRLNWIPLGGYVKMLGQDDLDPTARSESERSYTRKSVGKRMVIVSAGVIMNIILAIILFAVLFRIGFNSPPPIVGTVLTGSPAQQAGLQVGDYIETIDGRAQADFTKIGPNIALSEDGQPLKVFVKGRREPLMVTPRRSDLDPNGFLSMGIGPMPQLSGPDPIDVSKLSDEDKAELAKQPVQPGEIIVAINGQSVGLKDYPVLSQAIQSGNPVQITVENAQGQRADRTVKSNFASPFDRSALNFAGMMPRPVVFGMENGSSAKGKLEEEDIITELVIQPANDHIEHPSRATLTEKLNNAGQQGLTVDVTVLREGQKLEFKGLTPTMRLGEGRRGLGISLVYDEDHPVVADVLPDSAAQKAQIPAGATIKSIGGQTVQNWHDVQRVLAAAQSDAPIQIELTTETGEAKQVDLLMTRDQLAAVRQNHFVPLIALHDLHEPRQTRNPLIAAQWGLSETRDLMVQFYGMLKRMVQGSVPASGAMGPIGIFHTGSKIANRGVDWLIWFLAMISANLAVVNFLPIPIVDGGLFMFLILEKIMGKPLSAKAQGIAQIVGLALIGCVFLFVTYNDISRLIF